MAEADIGGPMGKHWEHFKIRRRLPDLSSPPGVHTRSTRSPSPWRILDACDALTNDVAGNILLIRNGTCDYARRFKTPWTRSRA